MEDAIYNYEAGYLTKESEPGKIKETPRETQDEELHYADEGDKIASQGVMQNEGNLSGDDAVSGKREDTPARGRTGLNDAEDAGRSEDADRTLPALSVNNNQGDGFASALEKSTGTPAENAGRGLPRMGSEHDAVQSSRDILRHQAKESGTKVVDENGDPLLVEDGKTAGKNVQPTSPAPPDDTQDGANSSDSPRDTRSMNLIKPQKNHHTLGEKISEGWGEIQRKFVNTGHTIEKLDKGTGKHRVRNLYNHVKQSFGMANFSITGAYQTDFNGKPMLNRKGEVAKSLANILKPIKEQGKEATRDFYDYLRHWHNIDRMKQGKPVFGEDITAKVSAQRIAEYERKHPDFRAVAEDIWTYGSNWLDLAGQADLVSQQEVDRLHKIYPHYVPTHRVSGSGFKGGGRVAPTGNPMREATGGVTDMIPLDEAFATQTMNLYRNAAMNQLGIAMVEALESGNSEAQEHIRFSNKSQVSKKNFKNAEDYIDSLAEGEAPISFSMQNNGKHTLTAHRNGRDITMTLDRGSAEGINALLTSNKLHWGAIGAVMEKATQSMKALTTTYDPTFMVRNFLKDMSGALIFSKDLPGFVKNIPAAFDQMKNGGDLWQQYQALGGVSMKMFDPQEAWANPIAKGASSVNAFNFIERGNIYVEQFTRFVEFMASMERTGDPMEAMYDAADVTVNFNRGGSVGMKANRIIPFFNAAMQGADKITRTLTQTQKGTTWVRMVVAAAATGIVPELLNEVMYGGDDEASQAYNDLPLREKANYYLFWSEELGVFIKIPKGRIQATLAAFTQSGINEAKGEDAKLDEALAVFSQSNLPTDPSEGNILSMATRTDLLDPDSPGKTWWGGDIESMGDQMKPVHQRYDEKTSRAFVKLADTLNKAGVDVSPKKMQDAFDSYTGFAGDVLIALTTPQAEGNIWANKFTTDPVYTNNISSEFYGKKDEYTFSKNDKNSSAEDKSISSAAYRYLNDTSTKVNEIYDEIEKVETSTLNDNQKRARVRELRGQANGLMREATSRSDEYEEALRDLYSEAYGNAMTSEGADQNDVVDELYLLANREVFGAEYALKEYDERIYGKAQQLYQLHGISYEDTFDFYFNKKNVGDSGAGGQDENDAAREWLYENQTLSDDQKSAIEDAFIYDGYWAAQEVNADWSGDRDAFEISLMSTGAQNGWARLSNWAPNIVSVDQYADLYEIVNASDKHKEEKLSEITAYTNGAWSLQQAEAFWDIIKGNGRYK